MPTDVIRKFINTGSPEGAVAAPVGSVYYQTDAASGFELWRKQSGTGNTGWQLSATSANGTVDTIAALKALSVATLSTGVTYQVNGYYAAADGGGGAFRLNKSSSATDNGGTVIAPNSGSGRWERVFSGPVMAQHFGVMPSATTTQNTAGLNAATSYASTAGLKTVVGPGTHWFNGQLIFNDQIVQGQGINETVLYWPSSLGAGVYAIDFQTTAATTGLGWIRDMSILGPGSPSLGVAPTNMHGVRVGGPHRMYNVQVWYFNQGFAVDSVQGHSSYHDIQSSNNYYGLYFTSTGGPAGDTFVYDSDLSGNTFGNIAASGTGAIHALSVLRTHAGFAPYGIYQESGADASVQFAHSCTFDRCYFEAIGNAAIYTENWSNSPGASFGGWSGNVINDPGFSWNSSYKIAARDNNYAVRVGYCGNHNKYWGALTPFLNGAVGTWYLDRNYCSWHYDDRGYFAGYSPAEKIVVNNGYTDTFLWMPRDPTGSRGTGSITSGTTSATISVYYAGPQNSVRPLLTLTATGGSTNPALYVTSITSSDTSASTSFTVNVVSAPTSTLTFNWSLV